MDRAGGANPVLRGTGRLITASAEARLRCIVVQNNVNWLQASALVLVTTSALSSWVSKENPTDTANGLGSTNLNEQLEEHYTETETSP
jgi:hypothetical protein